MEKGKFYLFASPWFWTCVGRYVRHLNFQDIEIADAIYFTRTGAVFIGPNGLATIGLQKETIYHGPAASMIIPSAGLKIPWLAPTPWAKERNDP